MANRRDKEKKKKDKRLEKQRAAKNKPRPRPDAAFDTSVFSELPTLVAGALASGPSEEGAIEAAAIAERTVHRALDLAWENTEEKPACGRGCSFCCKGVRVDATVPEIARVVSHARATLSPGDLARVTDAARANAARTHGTDARTYPPKLPCAFLGDDGACIVYEARPIACRKEHSLDVDDCRAGYENEDPSRDVPQARSALVYELGTLVQNTYLQSLATNRVDARTYELQEAVHVALSDPDAMKRWASGDDAFASARSMPRADVDRA